MEFTIPFPSNNDSTNTYKELKSYLKQFELAIHYAQKMVEHAEKEELPISEDCFVTFDYPAFSQEEKDNMYDQLQNVALRVNIQ